MGGNDSGEDRGTGHDGSPRSPLVSVLAAGGTIAMTGNCGRNVQLALTADDVLTAIPSAAERADVTARSIMSVPGPHMDLAHVDQIAHEVETEIQSGADGVVVTQGTDSIEETSFALELMLNTDTPVVVTGAMRSPDASGADGPANLLDAVSAAGAPQARGLGVCVLMDGEIHAPRFVSKSRTNSVGAFDAGPTLLGQVTEGRVIRLATLPRLPQTQWYRGARPAPVALLTAALGDDGALLDYLRWTDYAGLVIAGLGGGHVHPSMTNRIQELAAYLPVLIASRSTAGYTLAETYGYTGGDIHLASLGTLRAGWLNPLKARIALSLLLGSGRSTLELRHFFETVHGG